jgi:mono/diheme cytochrome c family protein
MKVSKVAAAVSLLFAATAWAQTAPMQLTAENALVKQYCAGCHNDRLKSGGFSWQKIDLSKPGEHAEQLEHVIRKMRAGMMPPAGMPRPTPEVIHSFIDAVANGVDQASAGHLNPGRPPLHRLNRTEYANSIRDLLNVNIDVSQLLPPDDSSHGFDNMADALTMSPALMEGYVRAAGRISREAVGDKGALAVTNTYQISRVVSQTRHMEGAPIGTRGGIVVTHDFPADGDYVFKLGFYYSPTGPLFGLNQGKGQQIEVSVNGERAALIDINPAMTLANDGIKTPPIHIKAGPQKIAAAFIATADGPLEDEYRMVEQSLVDVSAGTIPGVTTLPHLHELSITGPVKVDGLSETPARRKIFSCRPTTQADELPCAKKILATLARQAYRRPVNDNDIEALLGFFQRGRNAENDFESGIRTAIQAMIASPEFVFRFERVPANAAPGTNYRITDLELASRMSYFLWSTLPDDQLITLASQNKLHEPAILEKQVKRMLADPKSNALTDTFAFQWLHLQNLKEWSPDLFLFPDFDRTLSQSAVKETELLFDNVMRQDRPLTELLTANYTFVNERLAKHYGIPDILGDRFRRVTLTDPNRFGLLGQSSILMLTSYANRTSPTVRGKYVMEVILGTPPPNPPPNVPAFKEVGLNDKPLSVRERIEEHRKNEPCRSCHQMMDPIGLALENYNAVGQWRTNDEGFKIDATGKMFDGAKLDGPVSLRQAILSHSDAFIDGFTESMMAYGLGRVIDTRDMPFVRGVEREAAKNENRFSAFITGIIKSPPFQLRRTEDAEPVPTVVDHVAQR